MQFAGQSAVCEVNRASCRTSCGDARQGVSRRGSAQISSVQPALKQSRDTGAARVPARQPVARRRLVKACLEVPELGPNVLCNAVLMHLPAKALAGAVQALIRMLRPGGRLVLTFRPSSAEGERESDGRLFTSSAPDDLARLAAAADLRVLRREVRADDERPAVIWHSLVAERE